VIEKISSEGHDIKAACELLDVSRAGFYAWKDRPLSATAIRQAWLTDQIAEIHVASRGTCGAPRVHAELRLVRSIVVGHNQVARLMRTAGLVGLPLKRRFKKASRAITSEDLVNRAFGRSEPDRLWVTDITEHRTPRRKALLLRRARRPQPPCRRLVDRPRTHRRAHHERVVDGDREPPPRPRTDHPRRSRHARRIHLVGLYRPRPALWTVAVDGNRRRLLRL